jgi:hypothetical protein
MAANLALRGESKPQARRLTLRPLAGPDRSRSFFVCQTRAQSKGRSAIFARGSNRPPPQANSFARRSSTFAKEGTGRDRLSRRSRSGSRRRVARASRSSPPDRAARSRVPGGRPSALTRSDKAVGNHGRLRGGALARHRARSAVKDERLPRGRRWRSRPDGRHPGAALRSAPVRRRRRSPPRVPPSGRARPSRRRPPADAKGDSAAEGHHDEIHASRPALRI